MSFLPRDVLLVITFGVCVFAPLSIHCLGLMIPNITQIHLYNFLLVIHGIFFFRELELPVSYYVVLKSVALHGVCVDLFVCFLLIVLMGDVNLSIVIKYLNYF